MFNGRDIVFGEWILLIAVPVREDDGTLIHWAVGIQHPDGQAGVGYADTLNDHELKAVTDFFLSPDASRNRGDAVDVVLRYLR
jgi:hypothetical protein